MSSVNLNTSQVVAFLNNYNNTIKPNEPKNTLVQLPVEQTGLDPLTRDVLVSMHNITIAENSSEASDVDGMLRSVFGGGKSLPSLSSAFSNQFTSVDNKEIILARFAMKFLFDKVLEQNDHKMAEVVKLLSENPELKEAVKQVLAELEDKTAMQRFDKVFSPKKQATESSMVDQANMTPETQSADNGGETSNKFSFIKTVSDRTQSIIKQREAIRLNKVASSMNLNTDDVDKLSKVKGVLQHAMAKGYDAIEYSQHFKEGHENHFVNNGMREESTECLDYKEADSVEVKHKFGHNRGFVKGHLLEAVFSFNTETGEVAVDTNNVYFQRAVERRMRRGLSKEEAVAEVIGRIQDALQERELERLSAQLEASDKELDVLMKDINTQLQRIETLRIQEEYEQAKATLRNYFEDIKVSIVDFFGKEAKNTAKILIESMLFCTRQDNSNLNNIKKILDNNIASMIIDFKLRFAQKAENKKVDRAIDVAITVYKKRKVNSSGK